MLDGVFGTRFDTTGVLMVRDMSRGGLDSICFFCAATVRSNFFMIFSWKENFYFLFEIISFK